MLHPQRGFIPLVAIVLLGLVAVAGGAIAAFSIHNTTANKEAQAVVVATSTPEQTAAGTSTAYSAPVSARVQSSGAGTTLSSPETPSTPVAPISTTLDADTQTICTNVGPASSTLTSANSLQQSIQLLCKRLETPAANTPEQQAAWQHDADLIKQKGKIWLPTWDSSLLQTFLADPTPDGYRTLCAKAGSVSVPFITKLTLSADRTTEVTVPETLADAMQCDLLNEGYVAMTVTPGLLQWSFKDNDTDYIRQQKIEYAQNLSALLGSSKVIVLDPGAAADLDPSTKHVRGASSYTYALYTPDICGQQLINNRTVSGGCSSARSLLSVVGSDH